MGNGCSSMLRVPWAATSRMTVPLPTAMGTFWLSTRKSAGNLWRRFPRRYWARVRYPSGGGTCCACTLVTHRRPSRRRSAGRREGRVSSTGGNQPLHCATDPLRPPLGDADGRDLQAQTQAAEAAQDTGVGAKAPERAPMIARRLRRETPRLPRMDQEGHPPRHVAAVDQCDGHRKGKDITQDQAIGTRRIPFEVPGSNDSNLMALVCGVRLRTRVCGLRPAPRQADRWAAQPSAGHDPIDGSQPGQRGVA
jgi:hypothetical protein